MWEKIKQWWADRKERKYEKKLKNELDLQIAVNQLLDGGPNWIAYNVHQAPILICSIYFESDKDWIAVDFSREKDGIVHYIAFTPNKITYYENGKKEDANKKEIHTVINDAVVYIKYYQDGSEGWCFSCCS